MKTVHCPTRVDFPALLEFRGKVVVIRNVEAKYYADIEQSHYWAGQRMIRFRTFGGEVKERRVSVIRPKLFEEMSRDLSGSMSPGVPVRKGQIKHRSNKRALPSVRIKAPKARGRSRYERSLIALAGGGPLARRFRRILKEWKQSLPRHKNHLPTNQASDNRGAILYFPE